MLTDRTRKASSTWSKYAYRVSFPIATPYGIEPLLAPLLAMRHYYDDDLLERMPGILGALATVIGTEAGLDVLMALWHYLLSTNRVGEQGLEGAVQAALPGEEGADIMAAITAASLADFGQGLQGSRP